MTERERALLISGIILILVLGLPSNMVSAAASGQCYPNKPTYQFDEIVYIVISTPTGINNTKIVIYLPTGQVNSITVGKVGVGVWQRPLGPAGPPSGQRMVVLMDAGTVLFTTSYTVVEPSLAPTPATTSQTIIQYQTVTVPATVTRLFTVMRTEATTETVVSTLTSPPPTDLLYLSFIAIVALVIALLVLALRVARRPRSA